MSVAAPVAWSHSRIKTFMECQKKFWHLNLLKDVPYEQGEPQAEGERVHKALEKRLTHHIPLEPRDVKYESLVRVIEAMPGIKYGERDLALDANLRPCGYFDKGTWVRVTIDVTVLDGKVGWLFDYKNGKVTLDDEQLMLYAATGFHFFPDVDVFHTKYIWLQHKLIEGHTYTRTQLPELWRTLLVKPAALQKAAAANHWPARPGRACGYCPVNKYGKCAEAGERYRGS